MIGEKKKKLQLASGSSATPRYLVLAIRGHVYMAGHFSILSQKDQAVIAFTARPVALWAQNRMLFF